jgi:opine dehydrogenase
MRESAPNRTIKAPPTLDHRYLHEDVGYGLVPIAAFGRAIGIVTPVIDGLISVASAMNGVDYRREGLTLEKMGLANVAEKNFRTFLHEGL